MIRANPLLLGFGLLALGQAENPQQAFLREVTSLSSRVADGRLIEPKSRIQEDLRFSADAAEAVLSTTREYNSDAEIIERGLKRSIFERRLQVMAGDNVSVPPESELVAESNRQLNALLVGKMQQLRMRLGEDAFQRLTKFIEDGSRRGQFFSFTDGEMRAMK